MAKFHPRLKFLPAQATHSIFCHASAKGLWMGSMQQPGYSTETIFHEINDLVLFILSVMYGGYII